MAEKESPWLHSPPGRYRACWSAPGPSPGRHLASLPAWLPPWALAPLLGSEFLPKLDEGNIWLTISLPQSSASPTPGDMERRRGPVHLPGGEGGHPRGPPRRRHRPQGPQQHRDPGGPQAPQRMALRHQDALVDSMSGRPEAIPGLPTNFSQVIQDSVEESSPAPRARSRSRCSAPTLEVLETGAARSPASSTASKARPTAAALPVGGQSKWTSAAPRRPGLLRHQRHRRERDDPDRPRRQRAVNAFYEGRPPLRRHPALRPPVPATRWTTSPTCRWRCPTGTVAFRWAIWPTWSLRQGASRIQREAGSRNVIVKANLRGRDRGSFVAEAQKKVAAEVSLPAGYTITWGGQFENQRSAMARLKLIVPITLRLIFSLLFWAFRDIRPAMLVLSMVPFTLIGGFASLPGLAAPVGVGGGGFHRGGRHLGAERCDHGRAGHRDRPPARSRSGGHPRRRHAAPAPHRDDRPDGRIRIFTCCPPPCPTASAPKPSAPSPS